MTGLVRLPSLFAGLKGMLVCALTGFLLGGVVTGTTLYWKHRSDQLTETRKTIADLQIFFKKDRENYVIADGMDRKAVTQAIQTIDRIRVVETKVPFEVVKYVSANPICDLTVGAVRLLNDARLLSDPDHRAAEPEPDGESQAATDLDLQKEVAAHADCAARYAELAARHNALTSLPLAIVPENPE